MKYNQIKIISMGDRWRVEVHSDGVDRVEMEPIPSANGYYSCPETIPVPDGVEKLKAVMIKRHEYEIERLKKSLEELRKVEYGKTNQN